MSDIPLQRWDIVDNLDGTFSAQHEPDYGEWVRWADVERLEAENAKLRAALETYAEHGVRCSSRDYEAAMEGKEYPCDCGLDELLKGGWR